MTSSIPAGLPFAVTQRFHLGAVAPTAGFFKFLFPSMLTILGWSLCWLPKTARLRSLRCEAFCIRCMDFVFIPPKAFSSFSSSSAFFASNSSIIANNSSSSLNNAARCSLLPTSAVGLDFSNVFRCIRRLAASCFVKDVSSELRVLVFFWISFRICLASSLRTCSETPWFTLSEVFEAWSVRSTLEARLKMDWCFFLSSSASSEPSSEPSSDSISWSISATRFCCSLSLRFFVCRTASLIACHSASSSSVQDGRHDKR
mmetsp:Transcript_75815/g.131343  ORF Transcript_75815/g.131343 Transcript_75815/m.131343 type:complete len:258 (+) Transcript_75815:1176-1949(+)